MRFAVSKIKKSNAFWLYVFITPGIIGFLFFWLFPLCYTFYLSLTKYDAFTAPVFTGLSNFAEIFRTPGYWNSIQQTLFMVVVGVPFNLIVALGLALLLNHDLRGRGIFRTVFYIPTILPAVSVFIIANYLFSNKYGLLNKFIEMVGLQPVEWLTSAGVVKLSLIIMGGWSVGRTMIIYLAGLQGISEVYYEAADIDGANGWQKFTGITLPQLTPSILYNVILECVNAIQIFTPAYVLTKGGPDDATYFYVYKLYRDGFGTGGNFGIANAEAVVLFVVAMFFTYLIMKSSNMWVHYEGGDK